MSTRVVKNEYGFMPQRKWLWIWWDLLRDRDSAFSHLETAKSYLKSLKKTAEVVWEESDDNS